MVTVETPAVCQEILVVQSLSQLRHRTTNKRQSSINFFGRSSEVYVCNDLSVMR
jgi:hypothetical protein